MKHELAIIALWLLAVVATLFLVHQSGVFTFLGPLYFICMLGSVYIVRSSKKNH